MLQQANNCEYNISSLTILKRPRARAAGRSAGRGGRCCWDRGRRGGTRRCCHRWRRVHVQVYSRVCFYANKIKWPFQKIQPSFQKNPTVKKSSCSVATNLLFILPHLHARSSWKCSPLQMRVHPPSYHLDDRYFPGQF